MRLHRWGLGFRQSSFRPITRVLRDGTFSVFQWLPLFGHAVVPSGFRLQVNPMTQEHSSEFLLTASGIQHRVPRHTVSKHPALQWSTSGRVRFLRLARPRRSPGVDLASLPDDGEYRFGVPHLAYLHALSPSDHLTPFAMWPAFPASDYYGVSVAVGLAPPRQS